MIPGSNWCPNIFVFFLNIGYSMRADEMEYEEDEREPIDGEGLEEGPDVDDDEDEEEGMNFDWVQIFCSLHLFSVEFPYSFDLLRLFFIF